MIEVVHRRFVVDAPLGETWDHLARVEEWPTWAHHIKSVRLSPPGLLTAESEGGFTLGGGVRSTFRMEVFEPPRRWQWVGRFLTVTVHYDHHFESINDQATALTWIVKADGLGAGTVGRVFGVVYRRNLDRAIPRLQEQLRATADRE